MRNLERNREFERRRAARAVGQNPTRQRELANEAQNLSTDADIWGLPVDLTKSEGVQDSQGRFKFLAGYDGV